MSPALPLGPSSVSCSHWPLCRAARRLDCPAGESNLHLSDARALLRLPHPDLAEVVSALEEGRAQAMRAALDLDAVDPSHVSDPATRTRAEAFVFARDAWRAAQRSAAVPLPADLSYRDARDLRETRRAAALKTRAAFDQAVAAIREHDNPDFLSPVVRLQDPRRGVDLQRLWVGPGAGLPCRRT